MVMANSRDVACRDFPRKAVAMSEQDASSASASTEDRAAVVVTEMSSEELDELLHSNGADGAGIRHRVDVVARAARIRAIREKSRTSRSS